MHPTRVAAAMLAVVGLLAGCDDKPVVAPTPLPTIKVVDYSRWVAGRSKPLADRTFPARGNPDLDVLHYDLKISWEPTSQTLTGLATLHIRPMTDASQVVLDFMPYRLDRVDVGTRTVANAAVRGEKLVVPVGVIADQPITLSVAYHGRPATTPAPALREDADPLGLTVTPDGGLRTMQVPYGAYTWYPANDQPSDEALYDISVTVPTGWSAVAAGSPNGQGGNTFYYRSPVPTAPYQQTLAVGAYQKITATGPRRIPLTYWYRPGVDDRLLPTLRKSPNYLAFLEQRFGKYPFPAGGVVVVDSVSDAPTQQMITVGGRFTKFDAATFGNRLARAWADQWFGAAVTPSTWDDRWLSEGWATYAQYLVEQAVYHLSDQALDAFLRRSDADLRRRMGPPRRPPAGDVTAANLSVCPAAMLHRLHVALGDQRFFALATAWVQKQRNTQQTRASFITFVNKQTGDDYSALINAWLDAPSTPN